MMKTALFVFNEENMAETLNGSKVYIAEGPKVIAGVS